MYLVLLHVQKIAVLNKSGLQWSCMGKVNVLFSGIARVQEFGWGQEGLHAQIRGISSHQIHMNSIFEPLREPCSQVGMALLSQHLTK